ncbi:MAG TPA: helix-hairpin-helix domain-containing protein [Candidatus Acidoferrum sp.]|jgi:comEA protein
MSLRFRFHLSVLLLALVCYLGSFPLSAATKKPPAHPIDINSASSVQLQEVPGIGPATAEKILQMRKSYGAFKSVDDLMSVRGIGAKRLEKMRKYLVAGHAAPRRGNAASPTAAKGTTGANSSRAAPAKTAAVTPAKVSKPVASDGDAGEADEEPE